MLGRETGDVWDVCAAGAGDMIADLKGCGDSALQEANATFIVQAVNARDADAKRLKAEFGDSTGIFALNIDERGRPSVGSYSGAFFEGEDA